MNNREYFAELAFECACFSELKNERRKITAQDELEQENQQEAR